MSLMYEQETYKIRQAVFEVYNEMGSGFLESVYQECLEKECFHQDIPSQAQLELSLTYKGELLEQKYVPDLICFEKVVVELKAVKEIAPEHEAQLLNYLKATSMRVGLLVNFGAHPSVQIKRYVR